ncbi:MULTISPECIES: SRPBCC family protein [Kitasatospora]|uniref:Polyketide cyclase/dehydrase/lipid transport protein n=2 Tax=Kitasatospora TaxID=2063 RepID=A0ABT1J7M4_9ACTN|nr:SRPBCC family protein [Kitasatospora paracochleata]MCP2313051.1 hypothetical protein [Kitasatospora paracochleata]
MRYSDGPVVQCEIRVEAPVERVWELVADIGLPARLSPELQRVEWVGGADRPALGARFEGYNRHPVGGEWRTLSQVVELEAGRVLGWAVMDVDGLFGEATEDPAHRLAAWRFEVEPEDGGTRLRQSVQIGPGRSGVSPWIDRMPEREEQVVATRLKELRAGIEATLGGIKALAEEGRAEEGGADRA